MHPGELVREAVEYLSPSVARRAAVSGISRDHLDAIMAGRAPITPVIARRLGQTLGNSSEYWLRLQAHYDAGNGLSPLTAAILETADDMHRAGIMDEAGHVRILVRMLGRVRGRLKYSGASARLR
jgi:addiction module HigA family antidote